MMKNVVMMKNTSGITIFTGARRATSSAFCRRCLLEVEGAPPEQALTLEVRLDRSYGAARGRLVKALGASGPWLRIDVFRP